MKRLIIGLGLICGLIAAYYFLRPKEESTLKTEEINFAVEDVSLIEKVQLTNRDGDELMLQWKDGQWWVNDEYPAFQPFIDNFFNNTLAKIKVKGAVAKTAQENVIRSMIIEAIRVDISLSNGKDKSYYVGGHTPDMMGTYMHIKGATTPYVAYIPGLDGYITTRFTLDKDEWYDRTIFDFEPNEIVKVEVVHHGDPSSSFQIERQGEELVFNPNSNASAQAIKSYLTLFKFKNYDGFPEYLDQNAQDSILNSEALMTINVFTTQGEEHSMKVFAKGHDNSNTLVDKKGNVLTYDPERYFAKYSGFDRLVNIQKYVFEKMLVKRSDFSQ